MIRVTRQNHIGPRAPIRLQILYQTIETSGDYFCLIDSLSPSNGQNYRMSESRNRSVLINLLHFASGGLANGDSHVGIHAQQSKTRRLSSNPIRTNVWKFPSPSHTPLKIQNFLTSKIK